MNANLILRVFFVFIVTVVLLNALSTPDRSGPSGTRTYSDFIDGVKTGQVSDVVINESRIRGTLVDGTPFTTYAPQDPGLIGDLLNNGVNIEAHPPKRPNLLLQLLISAFPILLLIGVWIYFMRQQMGASGGGGPFSFGKSRARRIEGGKVSTRLADVAGVEEAIEEVGELVEFLRDPGKFERLGGVVPRGFLMVGSPGTGKTLLARAIAGEAGVPFFTASGSDFVEMFVGIGASRVRDLFKEARDNAPCIIFVDEIDAVGRKRGAGLGGGNDEREQTLNQILVEMDGFEGKEGVIVMAATNRPDVLDPALLRPGRFDRQVVVPLPDVGGREKILELHMQKVPIGSDVDTRIIARGTPGFSGADLANLVNEAALFAARGQRETVSMEEFERAKDKITMGSERRSVVMSEKERALTAYHEAGHTIVGRLVPEHDPVHKVSIIPRGRALGVTLFLPERDRYSASKRALESQISSLFGGRLAEELIYGSDAVTTGAQNDIERATAIARDMVTKWGLSDDLGPLAYAEPQGEVFLGQQLASQRHSVSEDTARRIDEEVRATVERNYKRARTLLEENLDKLHAMAGALVQYETLTRDQIDEIMAGQEPSPPPDHPNGGSNCSVDAPKGPRPKHSQPRLGPASPEPAG